MCVGFVCWKTVSVVSTFVWVIRATVMSTLEIKQQPLDQRLHCNQTLVCLDNSFIQIVTAPVRYIYDVTTGKVEVTALQWRLSFPRNLFQPFTGNERLDSSHLKFTIVILQSEANQWSRLGLSADPMSRSCRIKGIWNMNNIILFSFAVYTKLQGEFGNCQKCSTWYFTDLHAS